MADLRQRLVAFYQRHNPAMRPYQIDAIMREWGHNEPELWRQMAAKYGQRAVDDAVQVGRGAAELRLAPASPVCFDRQRQHRPRRRSAGRTAAVPAGYCRTAHVAARW